MSHGAGRDVQARRQPPRHHERQTRRNVVRPPCRRAAAGHAASAGPKQADVPGSRRAAPRLPPRPGPASRPARRRIDDQQHGRDVHGKQRIDGAGDKVTSPNRLRPVERRSRGYAHATAAATVAARSVGHARQRSSTSLVCPVPAIASSPRWRSATANEMRECHGVAANMSPDFRYRDPPSGGTVQGDGQGPANEQQADPATNPRVVALDDTVRRAVEPPGSTNSPQLRWRSVHELTRRTRAGPPPVRA